jgi:hypothetical protein
MCKRVTSPLVRAYRTENIAATSACDVTAATSVLRARRGVASLSPLARAPERGEGRGGKARQRRLAKHATIQKHLSEAPDIIYNVMGAHRITT